MDPATLAATIVGTYLLPYITKGATDLAGAVATKVGDAAAGFASGVAATLWDRVKGGLTSADDKYTLDKFKVSPAVYQKPLEDQLRQKLEQDPDLFKELQALLAKPGPNGQTATQIIENSGVLINLQQANLQGASNFKIVGVDYSERAEPALNEPPDKVPPGMP